MQRLPNDERRMQHIKRLCLGSFVSLLLLAGCTGLPRGDMQHMPVHILSAAPDTQDDQDSQDSRPQPKISDVIPVKQILRPQDVLDVILHITTAYSDAYRIQAGDQVNLTFFTAGELSGTHLVLPDGHIDLPYAGRILVAGLTITEAQEQVSKRYAQVLKRPEIAFSVARPMAQLENLRTTLYHPATGMSREITVGSDGRASFPLIGTLTLHGLTVDELRDTLNQHYAREIGQIHTDVMLKSTAPAQVYVLGEVMQPGAFPITRPISVLEALTLARGVTPGANLDSVVIMRRQGDQVAAQVYDVTQTLNGAAAQFAYLQADDLIFVPKTFLAKAGQFSRQLADVILFQAVNFGFAYRVDTKGNNN